MRRVPFRKGQEPNAFGAVSLDHPPPGGFAPLLQSQLVVPFSLSCPRHLPLQRGSWQQKCDGCSFSDFATDIDVSAEISYDFSSLISADSEAGSLCSPKWPKEFIRDELVGHSTTLILHRDAN